MARMLKGLLAELPIGNIGIEIPAYVRNDNSDGGYQVDSANAVTIEKRPNGFPVTNREELEKTNG